MLEKKGSEFGTNTYSLRIQMELGPINRGIRTLRVCSYTTDRCPIPELELKEEVPITFNRRQITQVALNLTRELIKKILNVEGERK